MIGVHVECDRCHLYFVYCDVPVTEAKRQARRSGWSFGKTETLCPACEPFKRAGRKDAALRTQEQRRVQP